NNKSSNKRRIEEEHNKERTLFDELRSEDEVESAQLSRRGSIASQFSIASIAEKRRSLDEISQLVNRVVPVFAGSRSTNVQYDLDAFIEGCNLIEEETSKADSPKIFRCIKMPLSDDARQQIIIAQCATIKEMVKLLRNLYQRNISYFECMRNL